MKNIFETGELDKYPTISILETVRREGAREVKGHPEQYRLDTIITGG